MRKIGLFAVALSALVLFPGATCVSDFYHYSERAVALSSILADLANQIQDVLKLGGE